jgi:YVTN family beta-propeller protein
MKLPFYIGSLLTLCSSVRAEYKVSQQYHIGGDASRWDYLTLDQATRYLYVAHFTKFEVLDVDSGKKVGELSPASRAHGVAIVPGLHRGFATSGNDGTIIIFDPKSLKITSRIKSGGNNPDAIQYDADTKKIFVVNGSSGTVSILDPKTEKVTGTVKLTDEGKLEQIGFDGRGRAFVNNEEKSVMHVFDTHTLKSVGQWSLAPGEGGTGLAVDAKNHRVFAACDGKLIVLDSDTGKVVASPTIGPDPDGVVFDVKTGRIFTSNADSTLTVLSREGTSDNFNTLQTVKTGDGAKQLVVDEKTGHVIVPSGKFQPSKERLPPVVPGSFELLVIAEDSAGMR